MLIPNNTDFQHFTRYHEELEQAVKVHRRTAANDPGRENRTIPPRQIWASLAAAIGIIRRRKPARH